MKRIFNSPLLAVSLSLILILSVPTLAYAQSDPSISEKEYFSEADSVSVHEEGNAEASLSDNSAFILESEEGSDDLFLVQIEEDTSVQDTEPELFLEEAELSLPEEEVIDLPSAESGVSVTIENGTCGPNAYWRIDKYFYDSGETEFRLIISGSGVMKPDDYDGYGTKKDAYGKYITNAPWSDYILNGQVIDAIIIEDGITRIASYSFYGLSSVSRVQFNGTTLTAIGADSFSGCSSLSSVSIPEGVSVIEVSAFNRCRSLTSVTLPTSLTELSGYTFEGCTGLTSISIPSGVTRIDSGTFLDCTNLTSVTLPSKLDSIYMFAFDGCTKLTTLTIPGSVTVLGTNCLNCCREIYYRGTSAQWTLIKGPEAVSADAVVHFAESIKEAVLSLSKTSYTYTSSAIKPSVTVTLGSKTLVKGTDYTVSYKNNTNVGTATLTVKGINDYIDSASTTFKIVQRSISGAAVTGVKNKGYTGSNITLSLTVKLTIGSKTVTLKKGTDYTVSYKNNKNLSTSSSPAQVTIKGTGNYKGSIARTFKIVKGNPGLSFAEAEVSRTSKTTFTKKAAQKVTGTLTLTYKSSNTSIATVDKSTGKVTPKKVGTTTISVSSAETKYFKAGSASYTLKIRAFKYNELAYSFGNYSKDNIPKSTFRIFFGSTEADTVYDEYHDLGKSGVCYGICASSVLFNTAGSGITVSDFSSSASHPKDLEKTNAYKNSGLDLQTMIEAMFVSQTGTAAQQIKHENMNKYDQLVSSIKTGKPAIIEMFTSEGGHAVVGYKVKSVNASTVYLYVYDSNHPSDSSRYITLKKSAGKYTGWSYPINSSTTWSSSEDGRLTFTPAASYKTIWKNRKGTSAISKMIISSTDDFEIRSADGSLAASMTNGTFTAFRDDVFIALLSGDQPDMHIVYMPRGAYSITNTSALTSGLNVTALNVEQSISVKTDADTILMEVDDEKGVNTAAFKAGKGQSYEVTLKSELPSAAGMEEVTFTGTGTGSEVTLGTEGSSCIIENAEDALLEINGENTAYVVFDGEAVYE